MSTQINDSASDPANATPPGQRLMGFGPITFFALYLVIFSLLDLYGLVKLWPHPTPAGPPATATPSPSPSPSAAATASPTATATASPSAAASPSATAIASPAASPTASPRGAAGAATSPTVTPSPSPAASPNDEGEIVYFFWGWLQAKIYPERRLLLLVMLTGALGSLMHALRSLAWYTGNREMVWSWAALYFLLPFTGAILAVIFYLVVRGGFFSPQAPVGSTSPFGFAALAALVGLFSPQATLKLKEVAETVFTKPGEGKDSRTQGSAPPTKGAPPTTTAPQVTSVTPKSGQASQGTPIVITGQGFATGVQVKVGNAPATVASATSTSINATAPPRPGGPGAVNIEVSNPDGPPTVVTNGFTYV